MWSRPRVFVIGLTVTEEPKETADFSKTAMSRWRMATSATTRGGSGPGQRLSVAGAWEAKQGIQGGLVSTALEALHQRRRPSPAMAPTVPGEQVITVRRCGAPPPPVPPPAYRGLHLAAEAFARRAVGR